MSKGEIYKKDDLIRLLEKATTTEMSLFYTEPCVYNDKKVLGSDNCCYDVVAEYLLNQLEQKEKPFHIKERARIEKPYNMGHKLVSEKRLAKSLLNLEIDGIGKIIDYETPIKDSDDDKGVGEIDLLAYNDDDKIFSIIELKRQNSPDSMLHTILQVFTYYHQINKDSLKLEFKHQEAKGFRKIVLIFKNSKQNREFNKSDYLKDLARKLDVEVFLFNRIMVSSIS